LQDIVAAAVQTLLLVGVLNLMPKVEEIKNANGLCHPQGGRAGQKRPSSASIPLEKLIVQDQ
jgi:hypothetical protein